MNISGTSWYIDIFGVAICCNQSRNGTFVPARLSGTVSLGSLGRLAHLAHLDLDQALVSQCGPLVGRFGPFGSICLMRLLQR